MSRYFKASDKKNGRRVIIEIYDEPREMDYGLHTFDSKEIGVWEYMDVFGIHHIKEGTNLYDLYYIHEISENEYKIYKSCQHIISEFYLHGPAYPVELKGE